MSSVITTDFERWKAQEAALGKPVALNEFVFANVPGLDLSKDISRDEKLPPAGQIVHRQAVNKAGLASENAVAYSVTLGTDVGDFVFNWIGLINKESGTLAMITHAPEQRKIKTVDGVQGNVLTRSFLLEFNGAAKETQITTSAETWQIDFTARLACMDEIQRLANRDIYGAAAFFGDGFLVTKAAEQYRVTPGTAYIEGLRGTLEDITSFNNLRDTKIYADFTFQGNLVSKWQTFVEVTTAKTLAHYQDAAGFQHYVAVIAEIDQNGNITDKRIKGTAIDRELAELKKDIPEKYQPKGDYVLEPFFKLEMLKKLDKADVVSQLGNDTGKAVSQHLLTTELGKKAPLNVADGKLAKDQNGADIADKKKFVGNLGLGDVNAAGVATGSLGSTGYAILPMIINGSRSTLIMQWGKLTPLTSGNTIDINLPIAFPTAIMQAYATHDNELHTTRPTVYGIGVTSRSTITATATQLTANSVGATVTRGGNEAACYGRYFVIGY